MSIGHAEGGDKPSSIGYNKPKRTIQRGGNMPPKGQRATSVPMFMLYTIDELVDRSGGYYSAGTLKDYRRKPGLPFGQKFRRYWRNLLRDDPRLQGQDVFGENQEIL